jgi:hypothetical protein
MTRFQRIALAFSLCCAVLLAVGAVTLINLTTQVSGTLPAANGGTGNTTNGTNGQVLIGDGSGHFTPQDPIISRNYATLITTLGATATQNGTSRVSTLSAFGTLYVTFASITGSPASCTLQLANVDNLGNSINNGSTIALTVANGTTSFAVTPAAALQTTDQIKATYNCGTFPTAGTITVVFSPGETTGIMFLPALPAGTNSIGLVGLNAGTNVVGKVTTDQTTHGTTDLVAADITKYNGTAVSQTNPVFIRESDGTNAVVLDPCRTNANIFKPISQTASAQLVTGTAAKKIYVCSINLVTAGANNVALVEGTGTTCATGIAGMAGGTTAATGWNFAANGGLTEGSGLGSIMAEATNADNLCLLQSAAVQLSGVIGYVVQ